MSKPRTHVDLDELMERQRAPCRVLHVDWAIVTGGTSAALTTATAACLIGTDREKSSACRISKD